jgi:IPT/TIG domain/FG-GAP-like repeat
MLKNNHFKITANKTVNLAPQNLKKPSRKKTTSGRFLTTCLFIILSLVAVCQPTITSFTPASGSAGTSVTITGTNFNVSTVNNAVYFGKVRATVNTSTATQIVCTVPFGVIASPISITNTSTRLQGKSLAWFKPTFSASALSATGFNSPVYTSLGISASPKLVQLADINNDGKLDIVAQRNTGQALAVARNTSGTSVTSFAAAVTLGGGTGGTDMFMEDANGDGLLDIAQSYNASVRLSPNTSSGPTISTGTDVTLTGGQPTRSIALADYNKDGKPDLYATSEASATYANSYLYTQPNTSTGGTTTFGSSALAVQFSANQRMWECGVADFDGDGWDDWASVETNGSALRVSRNVNGVFSTGNTISVALSTGSPQAGRMCIADVDGDGKPDILVQTDAGGGDVRILRNTSTSGSISFATGVMSFTSILNKQYFAVGDVTGDGKPDVVIAILGGTSTIEVVPNTSTPGSISFGTSVGFAGFGATDVAIGDVNGDGRADIVTIQGGTSPDANAAIFINNMVPVAAPTITSFTPTSGPVGTSVTITGTNFTGATAVSFNNTAATSFTINSATQITATVASGSTTGLIRVTTPGGTAASATNFTVTASIPTITSFTPTTGPAGTVITITGTNFTGATLVKINTATAASYTVNSATQITATVATGTPVGIGPITVTASGNIATSNTNFTVTASPAAPTITSFTPASGPVGTSVVITGTNFTGATAVSFNNTAATSFTVNSATQITATVATGTTTGAVRVTTGGGTATSVTNYTVTASTLPTITSFTPASGPVGTSVTITGTNFTGATAVSFNNTAAAGFFVNSATQITATVATGTTTGAVRVTAAGTTAISASNFTVTAPPATITSFTPASGPVGTTIVITGTGFTGATNVFVGAGVTNSSFTVNSATQITATVAPGTSTGVVSVVIPGFMASSSTNFTVNNAPLITSFTSDGFTDLPVNIIGQNLSNPTSITCNGIALPAANITGSGSNYISIVVPATWPIGTNPVVVTTPNGTSASRMFTITHYVNNYRPGSGAYAGFVVAMNGTRLSTVNTVTIGGMAASFTVVNDTRINVTVPNFGASLGDKTVTTTTPLGGTVQGPYPLRVIAATGPIITAISPLSGPVGSVVAIDGFNLNTVNTVRIGDVTLPNGTFTIVSANRINATVPPGAQSGFFVSVINPTTGNLSDDRFTVTAGAPPTITSVNFLTGPVNTIITVTGTNLLGATATMANGVAMPTSNNTATSVGLQVPSTGLSGAIRITSNASVVTTDCFTITTAANVLQHIPGQTLTLTSATTAATYQWQVNTGSGFVNIANNANYSGATTNRLVVTTAPTSWTGYQYRVVAGGVNGTAQTLRFVHTSLGGDWNDTDSWHLSQIPDQYGDVVLYPSSPALNVNVNAACRTLTANSTNQVRVRTGVTLTIHK